jgi:hypothetical protein
MTITLPNPDVLSTMAESLARLVAFASKHQGGGEDVTESLSAKR